MLLQYCTLFFPILLTYKQYIHSYIADQNIFWTGSGSKFLFNVRIRIYHLTNKIHNIVILFEQKTYLIWQKITDTFFGVFSSGFVSGKRLWLDRFRFSNNAPSFLCFEQLFIFICLQKCIIDFEQRRKY